MARHVRLQPAGAGQLSYDVTSEVAMTGENLALLNQGTFCVTLDTSAVYEAYPTGTTPPAGAITITAINGVWVLASSTGGAPGTPAYNPTWYAAANIYWDPANSTGLASDSNNGTTAITPLLTFGKILQNYGSPFPQVTQTVTLHVMSSQGAGVDPVVLSPILTGPFNYVVLGTLTNVGAAFAAGAITAKLQTTGGNNLKVAGFTSGLHMPGMVVFNSTRDSYAMIDSITGGGVATLTQPFAAAALTTPSLAPILTEDDGWTAGNNLQVSSSPSVNLKVIGGTGGDSNAGFSVGAIWVQWLHVPDVSGVVGNSTLAPTTIGCGLTCSMCSIDPFLAMNGIEQEGMAALSCFAQGGGHFTFASVVGGSLNTSLNEFIEFEDVCSVDGDAILHGLTYFKSAYSAAGLVYCDNALIVAHGGCILIEPTGNLTTSTAILWGPGVINLESPGSAVQNGTASTWVTVLNLSSLQIDGVPTGSKYVNGSFVDGVAITSANLDAFNGLQNPVSGSRYANASTPATVPASGLIVSGLTTAAMTGVTGQSGYMSGNSTASPTDNLAIAKSRFVGVTTGVAGQLQITGVVAAVPMTTAGGSPAAGAPLWLAASTDEAAAVGKWTATAPTAAGTVVAEVGICIDNTNYAGAKTVKALIQVKPPVQL